MRYDSIKNGCRDRNGSQSTHIHTLGHGQQETPHGSLIGNTPAGSERVRAHVVKTKVSEMGSESFVVVVTQRLI